MQRDVPTNWNLPEQWANWRAGHPESSLRDDAHVLGVSEGELLATGCGASVMRLRGGWVELLRGLQELGPLTVQTQSEGAVLEARGVAVTGEWSARQCVLRVGATRIRLNLDHWYHGFAVHEGSGANERHSFRFFDVDGRAVVRIQSEADTMAERWTQLVRRFESADQKPWMHVQAGGAAAGVADDAVDRRKLRADWDTLRDPEDLSRMLRRLGIPRGQAVRLAGPKRCVLVPVGTFDAALRHAARALLPLSLCVETPGAVQTYTGLVRRVEPRDGMTIVVEPGLRLYVVRSKIATAWLVRRPTPSGTLISLQYFDAYDQPVVIVGPHTLPGESGMDRWERLIATLSH